MTIKCQNLLRRITFFRSGESFAEHILSVYFLHNKLDIITLQKAIYSKKNWIV